MHKSRIMAFISLTKTRIALMVVVSTVIGFFLANHSLAPYGLLFWCIIGTFLSVCGSAVLNNYLERHTDKKMKRTCNRALPAGIIQPGEAVSFGTLLVLVGVGILVIKVNLLTGFLALLSAFLYVVVYTPLKRVTWLNTMIGAIPGALPPVGGWAAARGELGVETIPLFLILFVWQHPHFYAIAWLYREDYRRAGFQMLPAIDLDGHRTSKHVMFFSLLMIPVSLMPVAMGMTGVLYMVGAILLGIYMLNAGLNFIRSGEDSAARGLLRASLVYLPIILALVVIDSKVI
jgi:protoheme IX farnesyltransferase